MEYSVSVALMQAQPMAAVRQRMRSEDIPTGFKQPLDKVWEFLRRHPELRDGGHNLFLYRHDMDASRAMTIDFGVQVTRPFEREGEVFLSTTPEGEVASTVHLGPYDRLGEAHKAVHAWISKNGRHVGGWSWEIYGDWISDPNKLETQVVYLLE
jgi:effector-binding domain-containing protein